MDFALNVQKWRVIMILNDEIIRIHKNLKRNYSIAKGVFITNSKIRTISINQPNFMRMLMEFPDRYVGAYNGAIAYDDFMDDVNFVWRQLPESKELLGA